MADKFDEFLEEVENDIRQEKLMAAWKRYGKVITGAAVSVLVLVGAYSLWQNYEYGKRIRLAEKFSGVQELIIQGQIPQALTVLDSLTKESNKTYATLSNFLKAGILAQDGEGDNTQKAIQAYQALSADTSLDKTWHDLASTLVVSFSLSEKTPNYDDLLVKIDPIAVKTNPWYHLALELKGVILHQKGDIPAAADIFSTLARDAQTPEGISMRSQLMSQVLASELKG